MQTYTDYLMLIALPQALRLDIDRYKRASARLAGNFNEASFPAHILINQQYRCRPGTLRHQVAQIGERLGMLPPLELQLANFKYFKTDTRGFTIYACVVLNQQTSRWFKLLCESIGTINKSFLPHVAVVTNIPTDKFRLLWPKFEQCRYQGNFRADSLIVLERETYGTQRKWQKFKELPLGQRLCPQD